MLLKILPPLPHPTILFSFEYPQLPATLPLPPFYTLQVNQALSDDLDAPPTIHALDKACWPVALLERVTFNLRSPCGRNIVQCVFLDSHIEEWVVEDACFNLFYSRIAKCN